MHRALRLINSPSTTVALLLVASSAAAQPQSESTEPAPTSEATEPAPAEPEADVPEVQTPDAAEPQVPLSAQPAPPSPASDEPPSPRPPATPSPSPAEPVEGEAEDVPDTLPGPKVVLSPSLFTRYELRRNYATVGKTAGRFSDFDAVAYRTRLKVSLQNIALGDNASLEIVVNPQASGFWDGLGTLSDIALDLHEGYLMPHFGKSWFQLGRFEMVYGDQWLIGPVGWHQTGRSFDGARVHFGSEGGAWLDLFAILRTDGFPTTNDRIGAGDAYLLGAYMDLGPALQQGLNLDLYALAHLWPKTGELVTGDPPEVTSRNLAAELTVGGRIKKSYGAFDYRLEGGLQAGKRGDAATASVTPASTDVLAGAVDLELGIKPHPKVRLAGQGFYYSGDDPETSTNEAWLDRYSTAHKWNGWTDVMLPRNNQLGGVAQALVAATPTTKFGTHVHFFARPYLPSTQDLGYAGTEIDMFIVKSLLPGLALRADYDVYLPTEEGFGPQSEPVHYLGVELRYQGDVTFGG